MVGKLGSGECSSYRTGSLTLLDTHVLVWALEGDDRLGERARGLITEETELLYSAITAWELAMLVSKGKLKLTMPPSILLARATTEARMSEVDINAEMGLDAGSMVAPIHGDPADRFLMATARILDCPLLTADEKILVYAAAGHVKAIDARR